MAGCIYDRVVQRCTNSIALLVPKLKIMKLIDRDFCFMHKTALHFFLSRSRARSYRICDNSI